jgi:hypothetical protein
MADDLLTMKIDIDSRDFFAAEKAGKKFQRNLLMIEEAFRDGRMHAGRYNAEIMKQTKELSKLGGGYKKAQADVHAYMKTLRAATNDQIKFASGMAKSGKGMRNFELLAQQAGYQVGDFAVQVQSGTNVAVAFGQQMSQLLGFLGPYGALAGAGIAITTGIIAPFLKAKEEVNEFKEKLEELDKYIDSMGKPTTLVGQKSVELAALEDKLREQQEKISELRNGPKAPADGFVNPVTKVERSSAERYAQDIEDAVVAQQELIDATKAEIRQLDIKLTQRRVSKALMNSEVLEGEALRANAERQTRETNRALKENHEEEMSRLSQMDEAVRQFYDNQRKEIRSLEEERAKANKKAREAADKLFSVNSKRMQQEIMVNRVKIEYANDEEAQARAMEQVRIHNLNVLIKQANLQDGQAQMLRDQLMVLLKQEQKLREIEKKEKERIENARKLKEALEGANRAFKSTVEAGAGQDAYDPRGMGNGSSLMTETQRLRMGLGLSNQNEPSGGSKGKSPAQQLLEDYKDYLKELALEEQISTKLKDVFGEEREIQEEILRIKAEYGRLVSTEDEKEIERILRKIDANEKYREKLEEAKRKQEEIADIIGTKFEDAMMSIVDGTKSVEDAFRMMASEIIKELYRVLVVQEMVAAFKMGMSALGGGGSFLSGFFGGFMADGGQVSNNKAYIVGEEGPEVFMPRSQGTIIPNDKLGGGGNVTVVQHLNISTGVQQTVRSEIRQLMPQIAENAKAAVVDSKRRGGNFGKAFA